MQSQFLGTRQGENLPLPSFAQFVDDMETFSTVHKQNIRPHKSLCFSDFCKSWPKFSGKVVVKNFKNKIDK